MDVVAWEVKDDTCRIGKKVKKKKQKNEVDRRSKKLKFCMFLVQCSRGLFNTINYF